MEKVVLRPLFHRGEVCIGIFFSKNKSVQARIQKFTSAKWSRTKACWYLPCTEESYRKLKPALENIAEIEYSELKHFLRDRKKEKLTSIATAESKVPAERTIQKDITPLSHPTPFLNQPHTLSTENKAALEQFRRHLALKSYSPSTIRTYTNEFMQFLNVIRDRPAPEFDVSRLKDYLQYCHRELNLSENTLHSRINALKFYYEQVLGREKFFWEIPRPKKQHQLPKVFNQDEIASIINSVKNKKHKAMLMLAYSAGLRVSEVVALKTYQVDSRRMTLFISQSKGKKDRVVTLSPVLLVMLREYASQYKPKKNGYLFEGAGSGTPYSKRSLQEVLVSAKKKAGVMKPGSIHTLRHSFATHLIEKGTDVTMIQKLLGHNDIKTTLIYLHTSNKDLLKVISPLDDLKLK